MGGQRDRFLVRWAWAPWTLALFAFATTGCRGILGIHDLSDDTDGATAISPDAAVPADGALDEARPSGPQGDARADALPPAPDFDAHADVQPAPPPDASAQPTAQLVASQKTLDFGTAVVGRSVAGGQVQITNAGTASTGPLATSLTGSAFSVVTDGCVGVALAPALSCRVTIGVVTATAGPLSGTLTVTDTPADRVSIALAANVVAPGAVTIAPTMKDLGGVLLGAAGMPASFTVTNAGMTATGPLTTVLGGTSASEFSMVDGCTGKTLAAMAACAVTVTLNPLTAGPKTASLAVSGTPGGTGTASLTGTGLAPASLSIAPTSHAFAVTPVGTTTPPTATFVVTNAGSVASDALTTALVLGSGTANTDFVITADSCKGTMLASMATCSVTVQFRPATYGGKSAALAIHGGSPSAMMTGVAQDLVSLSITKSGAGGGTVADGAGTLACGATCSAQYTRTTANPMVTLTATPDASSVFAGWTGGGCSGTAPCTVTLAAATSVDAKFDLVQEALTVSFHGIGTQSASITSTPPGISCSGMSCTSTASFPAGTHVVLTVTKASTGIVGWSNGCTGTTCSVTLTAPLTVKVTTTNQNIVFVASQAHSGDFGGIAGAYAFCNAAARAAGVPGQFVAFLGTSTASAFSNLGSARGWIRPDGLPFTDTVAGFQNLVMWYPASITELGTTLNGDALLTGVRAGVGTCGDWTTAGGIANGGQSMDEGNYFTDLDGFSCSSANFLCFGTDFTVPVAVTPPPGRHVFASSGSFDAAGGLLAADAFCQAAAATAGLANATHFLAALSTTTASAASRFNLSGAPWVRTDGVLVATTTANFMAGMLLAPPSTDENGTLQLNRTWLGSAGGLATRAANGNESCNDWSANSASTTAVIYEPPVGAGTNAFTAFGTAPEACNFMGTPSLMCLEN